jgi:hypothetical protein
MWIIRTEIACVTLFTPRFPDPVVQTHIKTPDSEYVKIGELQCVDRVVMMVISSDGIAAWASDHIIWESNTVATRTVEPSPELLLQYGQKPKLSHRTLWDVWQKAKWQGDVQSTKLYFQNAQFSRNSV